MPLAALRLGILLAGAASLWPGSLAAQVGIRQDGVNHQVEVAQTNGGGPVNVSQEQQGHRAEVLQQRGTDAQVEILQSGTDNLARVRQVDAQGASAHVVQGGTQNRAIVEQQAAVRGVASVRQLGQSGHIALTQQGSNGRVAAYQGPLATASSASIAQHAEAGLAVVEQGVELPMQPDGLDPAAEFVASASRTAANATNAVASISQSGGAGLLALIIQNGDGPTASITQSGAYLQAQILQSGGAHSAALSQLGVGTAEAPYRASIEQHGSRPQSISITQVVGDSPRILRVVQQ